MTHPNSLKNLKLGAESRRTGKIRHHYTILPQHHQWLASGGNASLRLDELIGKVLAGELVGVGHLRKLEAENQRLREANDLLRSQIRNEIMNDSHMAVVPSKELDTLHSKNKSEIT